MNEHIADLAELYALGTLDEREAQRVDAHAATCDPCARIVGNAEQTVAALDAATVARIDAPDALGDRLRASARATPLATRRSPGLARQQWTFGTIAAGFALLVGGAAAIREASHFRAIAAQDDAIIAVVARSHFKHATLTKIDTTAPTSKALWGTSKDWVYVIVDAKSCACHVIVTTSAGDRDLGPPLERGATSAAFATDVPSLRRVELRRGDATIERTTLP